jgi:hypothetical protein
VEISANEDGMQRAARCHVDIAVDVQFEPNDAFRATIFATSQPLVLEPERRAIWWPVVLVGFVAVMCATVAFLTSPLASHPVVAPYANAVLATIG